MICKDKYESERFVLSHRCPAVLMGGYLRDLLFDRPWKDIDLFVAVSETQLQNHRTTGTYAMEWVGSDHKSVITSWQIISNVCYESSFAVFTCAALPGVQLILYTKHYNTLDTQYEMALTYMNSEFPCSLSRVAMALNLEPGDRWLYLSSTFEWSVRDRSLVFSVGCPQEYRDRMAAYFPYFTIKPDSPYF